MADNITGIPGLSEAAQDTLQNGPAPSTPSSVASPTGPPESPHDAVIVPSSGEEFNQVLGQKDVMPPDAESPATRGRRMLQAAVIQSASTGQSISDSWRDLQKRSTSGDQALFAESDKFNKDAQQAMVDLGSDQIINQKDPVGYVKRLNAAMLAQQQKDAQPSAKQQAFVDAGQTKPIPLDEDITSRLQLIDIAEGVMQDVGPLDVLGELGSSLIPGKVTMDDLQVLGYDNPFKAAEHYRELAAKIQALPPADRLKQFNLLKDEWLSKLPKSRAGTMLLGLVDPTATEEAANTLGRGTAIDAALDMTVFWGMLAGLRKTFSAIGTLSKLGNKAKAAEINVGVMQGDVELGKAATADSFDAMNNASPFLITGPGSVNVADISPAIHERLFQFRDEINRVLGGISDEDGFVKEGMLDIADKARAKRRIDDEFGQWVSDALKGENKIIKLQSQKETHRGVEFSYEVTDANGNVTLGSHTMPFLREDVTFWQNLPDNTLLSKIGSERWQASRSDFLDSVEAAIRLDTTSEAVGTQLRNLVQKATQPIRDTKGVKSRKLRLKDVDAILIYGDKKQKVFSPHELRMGVDGITLDDAQIETYYKLRSTFDGLGVLRNQETYNELLTKGAKQINFGGDLFRFGRIHKTVGEASDALRSSGARTIWQHTGRDKGAALDLAKTDLDKLYREGWVLSTLEDDVLRGNSVYRNVLVKADSTTDGARTIDELPPIVVDIKKGYIPRLNKKATWFVQAIRDGNVDGVLVRGARRKALRSFDNERDAIEWTKHLYQTANEAGFDSATRFIPVKDGELEAFRAGDSGLGATRGLITGHRAEKEIPHGFPGEFDENDARVGAYDALELYLENTKNFMTRNQWRMGMRLKWEKTAEHELGGVKVKFDEPGPALANKKLADMHKRVTEWSGFRDKSERSWSEFMRKTYEWAIAPKDFGIFKTSGGRRFKSFILNNRDVDPLSKLRSAAFHSLLGSFNPSQLLVQAQGAAVALATIAVKSFTDPGLVFRVFGKQQALWHLQHLGEVPDKFLAPLAKATGFKNVQELKDFKTIWDRTGYHDSMLSSADVEAAARGFPTTRGGFSKFLNSGLMFFRAGEGFNRRFSFATAVEEAGGASKLINNEDALKAVITRSNNLMLNLSKANRAAFQKGPMSIPTQFLQIQAKTLEAIFGLSKSLTPAERISLFVTQGMLYGPAGMFAGTYLTRMLEDAWGTDQIDINNMSPEKVAMLNGGLTDFMLAQMGIEGMFSDRAALFNGMDQSIVNLWTKDNTLAEWLLGPSGVPLKRVWQAWGLASVHSWAPQPEDGAVPATFQDVTDALTFFATDMGRIAVSPFSTASQISRFFLMRDLGVIKDTQGNTIAKPPGGYNPQTEWAALLGIKPNDLQKKFDLADINQAYDDGIDLRVNMLLANFDNYMSKVDQHVSEQTPFEADQQRLFRKRWHIIVDSIQDPNIREKVRERWAQKLEDRLTGNSQLDRQVQQYYRNLVTELTGAYTDSSTRLIQTRDNQDGVR